MKQLGSNASSCHSDSQNYSEAIRDICSGEGAESAMRNLDRPTAVVPVYYLPWRHLQETSWRKHQSHGCDDRLVACIASHNPTQEPRCASREELAPASAACDLLHSLLHWLPWLLLVSVLNCRCRKVPYTTKASAAACCTSYSESENCGTETASMLASASRPSILLRVHARPLKRD